ncbi:MAG: regulatory signaling modulator protein AmpE [Pseudohongiella sp.]|uniref:regulatory signaling modulator protein AmpE n=1 Tax=Pseudohongiella sp. TaxID=1979412 RepID=UPI00349FF7A7
MIFLTVITCLLINHYWRRERGLPVDGWFDAWQDWLISHAHRLPAFMRNWSGTLPVMALLLPMMPPALLLWLAEGHLLGLLSLGLHVMILLYCFTRFNLLELIENYLICWREGNYEAAYQHTAEQAPDIFRSRVDDYAVMHQQFLDYVLTISLRRLFAVLFWYIVLGPLAALLYFLLQQMLRSDVVIEDRADVCTWQRFLSIAEWVPSRLLALAFALAGDFVAAFSRLREHLLDNLEPGRNITLLTSCAVSATGKPDPALRDAEYRAQAVWRLEALRDLILRSQIVWVIAVAFIILVV